MMASDLVRQNKCHFKDTRDVNLLVQEIEDNLGAIVDIPRVSKSSNNPACFPTQPVCLYGL